MYVYNVRLEAHIEIEQRSVMGCLHRKGMKLPAIVAEPAALYQKDAFDKNRVKYWLHEIELHRSGLIDRPSSGRPLLKDADVRILQVLEAESWSSVLTIAECLKILVSMVNLRLTTSLNMKSRHFKWVPHFLDNDLRAKRLEGARQLLDVLQAQEKCYFRDPITRDETRV
jgi:hypothetical protein